MTVQRLELEFLDAIKAWIYYSRLDCDWCDATFPADGLMHEFPCLLYEGLKAGWVTQAITGLVMCPDCYRRAAAP